MYRYLMMFVAAALTGCGGSSGGSDSSESGSSGSGDEEKPVTTLCEPAAEKYSNETAQNAGLYRGYLELTADQSSSEGFGILSPSGRIAFIATNGIVTGLFSDSMQVSGSVNVWSSVTSPTGYSLNGVFREGYSIQGYNLILFDYDFRGQYQVPSADICLASTDATGSWSQTEAGETTTITIDADNDFTGSDSSGCIYSGTFVDPQVEGGIMEINATVSNCAKAGQYIGVGSILGASKEAPGLILAAMWNDSRVIPLGLER